MQKGKSYLVVSIVFIIFLIISMFIFHSNKGESPKFIKEGEPLSKDNEINKFVFIYLGSICISCPSGWLVHKLDSLQSEASDIKYVILLPDEFTKNDITNIKFNNLFKLDFINVSTEFQRLINTKRSLKNRYPFTGLTVVANSYGIVSYSQYLNNKGIGLKAKVHELVKHISKM